MKSVPLEDLTLVTFLPLVNRTFWVEAASGTYVELRLLEAASRPANHARQSSKAPEVGETFSLVFAGPVNQPLPQKIYPFENDQIGRFELFIVPVGRTQNQVEYEAVFNRGQ